MYFCTDTDTFFSLWISGAHSLKGIRTTDVRKLDQSVECQSMLWKLGWIASTDTRILETGISPNLRGLVWKYDKMYMCWKSERAWNLTANPNTQAEQITHDSDYNWKNCLSANLVPLQSVFRKPKSTHTLNLCRKPCYFHMFSEIKA